MRAKSFAIYFLFGIFLACNNQPGQPKDSAQQPKPDVLNCYAYQNKNDTIILKITNVNGAVTGTLVYNIYQKDKNMGTIQGKMQDELLIADYTFSAEGMESVRQVAFKKTGNDFIEGYGDVEDKNGKFSFKNIDSLSFNNSMVLTSVKCEE